MAVYDVMILLDENGRFRDLRWGNERTRALYGSLFQEWTMDGRRASSVFPLSEGSEEGSLRWEGEQFLYSRIPAPEQGSWLLLSKEDVRPYLFAQALDQLSEGVQVYDKNACAVFFNRASRAISHIPSGVKPEGRHLLDLYKLDEDISTAITALRTQSPVIDRVDRFQTADSSDIATANTAFPILRNGELMGVAVFEQTEETVQRNIKRLEVTRQALKLFSSRSSVVRFSGYTFDHIIGSSSKLRRAVELARKVADRDCPVLLIGETGTGKEIFAQSIHRSSPRSSKKFVAINCAALPEKLIESLLFGTQKGGFSGSLDKVGYFEEANGGTLFLDELNSMSLRMQSKILRVLQENTFRRVGGSRDIKLDVRIISSCNEDPFRSIGENRLRQDLFYRLSTVMIDLPPLREHPEDLPELVESHLRATAHQYIHSITDVEPQVYTVLQSYHWPGNVRELFHVLDYAQNVADTNVMGLRHLPSYLLKAAPAARSLPTAPAQVDFSSDTLQSLLDDYERQIILLALEHCGYNISLTAQTLGILRQSLQYRIRKYGIIF